MIDQLGKVEAVLVNSTDSAFLKVTFNEKDLKFFSVNISLFNDGLVRLLIWRSFYEMVKDGSMEVMRFMELLNINLEDERDNNVVFIILNFGSIISKFLDSQNRNKVNESMLSVILKIIEKSSDNRRKYTLLQFIDDYLTDYQILLQLINNDIQHAVLDFKLS